MTKKKVHNLKTIEDMCRIVTEENYVRLVMDMADCIGFHIKLKRELTKKEYSELTKHDVLMGNLKPKHDARWIKD